MIEIEMLRLANEMLHFLTLKTVNFYQKYFEKKYSIIITFNIKRKLPLKIKYTYIFYLFICMSYAKRDFAFKFETRKLLIP